MEKSSSFEPTWADQWDNSKDPEPIQQTKKKGNLRWAKFSRKVGKGLHKSMAVALTGLKKVKRGASAGCHWIKDKYRKTTQKH